MGVPAGVPADAWIVAATLARTRGRVADPVTTGRFVVTSGTRRRAKGWRSGLHRVVAGGGHAQRMPLAGPFGPFAIVARSVVTKPMRRAVVPRRLARRPGGRS